MPQPIELALLHQHTNTPTSHPRLRLYNSPSNTTTSHRSFTARRNISSQPSLVDRAPSTITMPDRQGNGRSLREAFGLPPSNRRSSAIPHSPPRQRNHRSSRNGLFSRNHGSNRNGLFSRDHQSSNNGFFSRNGPIRRNGLFSRAAPTHRINVHTYDPNSRCDDPYSRGSVLPSQRQEFWCQGYGPGNGEYVGAPFDHGELGPASRPASRNGTARPLRERSSSNRGTLGGEPSCPNFQRRSSSHGRQYGGEPSHGDFQGRTHEDSDRGRSRQQTEAGRSNDYLAQTAQQRRPSQGRTIGNRQRGRSQHGTNDGDQDDYVYQTAQQQQPSYGGRQRGRSQQQRPQQQRLQNFRAPRRGRGSRSDGYQPHYVSYGAMLEGMDDRYWSAEDELRLAQEELLLYGNTRFHWSAR